MCKNLIIILSLKIMYIDLLSENEMDMLLEKIDGILFKTQWALR